MSWLYKDQRGDIYVTKKIILTTVIVAKPIHFRILFKRSILWHRLPENFRALQSAALTTNQKRND